MCTCWGGGDFSKVTPSPARARPSFSISLYFWMLCRIEGKLCNSRIGYFLGTNFMYVQFFGHNLTVSRHFICAVVLYHEIFRTKSRLLSSDGLLFKAKKPKAGWKFGTGAVFPF